jgi:sulfite exporter TauE/SafE
MNLTLFARALSLGLTTGGFCLGICLPVVVPPVFGTGSAKGSAIRLGVFLLGRLIAYLGFGVFAGWLGRALDNYRLFQAVIVPAVYLLLGMLLIGYGITSFNPFARFQICRMVKPGVNSVWFMLVLGLLAGATPCPPFLLALTVVADTAGVLNGLLFFIIFFLATTVYFLPLFFAGILARFEAVRTAARLLAIITGFYFTLYTLFRLLIIN